MKGRKTLTRGFVAALAAALALTAGTAASASAATATFSNTTPILIPDSGPSPPYPSNITASGLAGNVQKATVTLRGFTHSCPTDLAVLLVGPSGAKSVLMGYVGGCPGTGGSFPPVDLTFDQASGSALNGSDYPVSGTYRPSEDGGPVDSLFPPAPSAPYPVDLNVFTGTPSNGTWSLFIDDQAGGDQGSVNGGWSLTLNAPINTIKAGKPKLNKKNGTARLPVTVKDAGQLSLRGKGVATVASTGASKSVAVGPGTRKLKVKPKGKTRKQLNATGTAKVKVKITFTPTGGGPSVTTKKIKLKKTV